MSHLLDHYLQTTAPEKRESAAIAYLASLDHISQNTPFIANAIMHELRDQRTYLKLIASENYSSLAVQLAMGNLLTDKYAEGYAHHRFYAGCENIDAIEEFAQNELQKLFGAECAYVQPHSGADANLVALWAIIVERVQNKEIQRLAKKNIDELSREEYEKIRQLLVNQKLMGLSLNSGGHLTHGYRHNVSSKMLEAVAYDVDPKTELIDYQALAIQVKNEKPLILLAGYSAHPRRLNFAKMREIANSVGAVLMVDMAHFAGLVAGKVFTGEYDPIPYADIVTSTTHKTLRGPRGGFILCKEEFRDTIYKGCPLVLGGPLPHVLAAKGIAFQEARTPEFKTYAHQIVNNCQILAERLMQKGIRLVTGGTENHLVILDLTSFGLTGRQAEIALRTAHLTLNRNAIPNDKNGPWYTSGLRLGTAAVTTLEMGKEEMIEIADIIVELLENTKPSPESKAKAETPHGVTERAKSRVLDLLSRYPLYPSIALPDSLLHSDMIQQSNIGVTNG